jgi:acyl-CoA reductase-like NAD-dependent aldehyde dehydrogenase
MVGQHVWMPRTGVAIHINAFNFPAWGMAEKAAVSWLAGVPVFTKPATSTSALAVRIVELWLGTGALPEGALSLLAGPAGDLLDHVGPQDCVAFTGGSDTAGKVRGHPAVVRHNVRVNIEADSLNANLPEGTGYFLEPILLEATAEAALDPSAPFHAIEVFGPVATLLPYDGTLAAAAAILRAGQGSLVSTLYSDDRAFTAAAIAELAPHLGRLVINDEKNAAGAFSPGCVFPQANHGGPGRAGCGAELGGAHGLGLYMQKTAIQGGASQLARIIGNRPGTTQSAS